MRWKALGTTVVLRVAEASALLDARALVEARLPTPDIRTTTDQLVRYLAATGQARAYRWGLAAGAPAGDGTSIETGGMDVTEGELRVVDAVGRAQPSRFAFGIPAEPPEWLTAAGARPGSNSKILLDADAIARAALRYVRDRPGTGPRVASPIGQGAT